MSKKKAEIYGYGIVDRNGNPWWSEECVCQDASPLQEVAEYLSDDPLGDPRAPYRVIKLLKGGRV